MTDQVYPRVREGQVVEIDTGQRMVVATKSRGGFWGATQSAIMRHGDTGAQRTFVAYNRIKKVVGSA